jgi:hypothetical protein
MLGEGLMSVVERSSLSQRLAGKPHSSILRSLINFQYKGVWPGRHWIGDLERRHSDWAKSIQIWENGLPEWQTWSHYQNFCLQFQCLSIIGGNFAQASVISGNALCPLSGVVSALRDSKCTISVGRAIGGIRFVCCTEVSAFRESAIGGFTVVWMILTKYHDCMCINQLEYLQSRSRLSSNASRPSFEREMSQGKNQCFNMKQSQGHAHNLSLAIRRLQCVTMVILCMQ